MSRANFPGDYFINPTTLPEVNEPSHVRTGLHVKDTGIILVGNAIDIPDFRRSE